MKSSNKTTICQIQISKIVVDPDLQIREGLNEEAVQDYAENLDDLPPILVIGQNTPHLLVDGFHRLEAAKRAGRTNIAAKFVSTKFANYGYGRSVITENKEIGLRTALEANQKHGLRLTSADKRRAIKLVATQWPDISNKEIARMVGCTAPTIVSACPERAGGIYAEAKKGKNFTFSPDDAAPKSVVPPIPKVPPRKTVSSSSSQARSLPASFCDHTNLEVPEETRPQWERATTQYRELLSEFTNLRERFLQSCANTEIDVDVLRGALNATQAEIKRAIPYAVCHKCNGRLLESCTQCDGRGYVSEHFWKVLVPVEYKELRAKLCKPTLEEFRA